MTPARTRQRNPRGEGGRLRNEITAAMIRLIDSGEPRPSLRAIAREVGIAGPSLYPHFAGVDEIQNAVIRACLDELIASIEAAQAQTEDPVARLQATCAAYLDYGLRFPNRYALMFQAIRDEQELAAVRDRGAAALQTLVDSITACRDAGLSTATDPYENALAVWSAIHGLTTLRATRPHFDRLQSTDLLPFIVGRLSQLN